MHSHAVALSTCDQNHRVSLQQLVSDWLRQSERCTIDEINNTSCFSCANSSDATGLHSTSDMLLSTPASYRSASFTEPL